MDVFLAALILAVPVAAYFLTGWVLRRMTRRVVRG